MNFLSNFFSSFTRWTCFALAGMNFLACSAQEPTAQEPTEAAAQEPTEAAAQKPTEASVTAATREQAEAFFQLYAKRSDFAAFLDFYAEDAIVEDIVNGDLVAGRNAIRAFFDWDNQRVVIIGDHALELTSLVVEGQQAVARGRFTEFLYDGQPLGPWRFVIALELNTDGKIERQEDFINYPAALLSSSVPEPLQGEDAAQPD